MDFRKILPDINKYIDSDTPHVSSNEKSHEGLIVPEIVLKYGDMKGKIHDFSRIGTTMLKTVLEVKKSYRQIPNQPKNAKRSISQEDFEAFKKKAESIGIQKLGFTEVTPSFIFKDKKILYKNAIVLLMEMDIEKIALAPSNQTGKEIFRTYHGLGVAVNKLALLLKSRGYNAQASPALGGDVNYPLLAQKAGLGAIGKHGLLITPEFGPSLRIAAIFTDITNLPITDNDSHMWVKDFCDTCNRCVRKCPAGAIYKDTVIFDNNSEQHIDYKKCAIPFSNDHGCTVCIKECSFFRMGYDNIKSKVH